MCRAASRTGWTHLIPLHSYKTPGSVKRRSWVPFKPNEGHARLCPSCPEPITYLTFTSPSTRTSSCSQSQSHPTIPVTLRREPREISRIGLGINEIASPAWGERPFQGHKRMKGITLFLVHAVGFPRYGSPPYLIYRLPGVINEIWSWDITTRDC